MESEEASLCLNYDLSYNVSLNQALFRCSSLNLKIYRLKWHRFETLAEVGLLNKCSKICVILNFYSLEYS